MKKVETSDRLKEIMKERGLRQRDILDLCKPFCDTFGIKMSRADLSQWVSGKFKPRQNKLSILAMALGVSEAWLMGYDVDQCSTSTKAPGLDSMLSAMGYSVGISSKTVRIPISQLNTTLPDDVQTELKRLNAFVSRSVEEAIITNSETGEKYKINMDDYRKFSSSIQVQIKSFLEGYRDD